MYRTPWGWVCLAALASNAALANEPGDIDGDGQVTVVDVQCGIITSLWVMTDEGQPPQCLVAPESDWAAMDVNCDGALNVVDVHLIVSLVYDVPIDAVALAQCEVEPSIFSGPFSVAMPSALEDLPLPIDPDDGGFTYVQTPAVSLVAHPEAATPVSAATGCISLVLSCYDDELRNVRGCLENVDQCTTEEPWEDGADAWCCPTACTDRYLELRAAGSDPSQALSTALLRPGSCMNGIDAMWEVAR